MDPDVIVHESTDWCKRWWKACKKKVPKGTRVATLRRQIVEWHEHLADNPDGKITISTGTLVMPCPCHAMSLSCHVLAMLTIHHARVLGCKPLPWQLNSKAANVVDKRIQNIVYPRGINGCSKDGISFVKVCVVSVVCVWCVLTHSLAVLRNQVVLGGPQTSSLRCCVSSPLCSGILSPARVPRSKKLFGGCDSCVDVVLVVRRQLTQISKEVLDLF